MYVGSHWKKVPITTNGQPITTAMKERSIQPDFWHYELPGGFEVLAGKTDADNDLLSLKMAKTAS